MNSVRRALTLLVLVALSAPGGDVPMPGLDGIPVVVADVNGVPIYTNIPNPWTGGTPPFIPENEPNNTVGEYRHTFTVPPEWNGQPVFITFDGVLSFFYLWINGQPVGMCICPPYRFEVSQALRLRKNTLVIEVTNTLGKRTRLTGSAW